MPYAISKSGGKFVLRNSETGTVFGRHKTRKSAERQMRLLHMLKKRKKGKAV